MRERIQRHEKLCGTIISLTDPAIGEIFGNAGYDYVWIDMEHTFISNHDVLCHMNAAKGAGIASIVRVPQNDLTATKKVLEIDDHGRRLEFPLGSRLPKPCQPAPLSQKGVTPAFGS